MIHDILLSLLNPFPKHLPIEDFVVSDAVSRFLHPGEKKILEDIIQIIDLHREIAQFTKTHGSSRKHPNNTANIETDEPLAKGLYLKAFVDGIEINLESYLMEMAQLERQYLLNASQSLIFIYHKISAYHPMFLFLQKLIRGIRTQRLHGCAIIQYLHQNVLHGNKEIYNAMKTIQSSVNVVFLKQLTHWILYAKIMDTYGEFFIQCSESQHDSTIESEHCTSTGSGRNTVTTMSDIASTYADIWQYEICYELLPHYLSSSWAEKVLFIGQTVLMFKVDSNKLAKKAQTWNDYENNCMNEASLWNGNEHVYFKKIESLQSEEEVNASHYERVINEIKLYVTGRLSEIAVNQADLEKQLKLIKEFYLLGRGELFLEFIRRSRNFDTEKVNENTLRELVKAFDLAAHGVGISEDLEVFTLTIPKELLEAEEQSEFGFIEYIALQYKIIWPLHLLFSPKVIERYNQLFRFLLLIKKMQYELHLVWCIQTRESKQKTSVNTNIMHLRNQLMFFIDNLQYYIQIDVLESQFSILMNTVLSSGDFEQIQRSHSIFQANVLSLCFLLTREDNTKTSMVESLSSVNVVYGVLNDIFHLCKHFCSLMQENTVESAVDQITVLEEKFSGLIEQLISMLVSFKAMPSSTRTQLSQLLLRLDFNHWFSTQQIEQRTQSYNESHEKSQ